MTGSGGSELWELIVIFVGWWHQGDARKPCPSKAQSRFSGTGTYESIFLLIPPFGIDRFLAGANENQLCFSFTF